MTYRPFSSELLKMLFGFAVPFARLNTQVLSFAVPFARVDTQVLRLCCAFCYATL